MRKQAQIYYSGKVQGVGFRFTVRELAQELGLFGWVKNLNDGKVEVLAQGEETALKDLLVRIQDNFSRYIHDVDIQWQDIKLEYNDFRVEF